MLEFFSHVGIVVKDLEKSIEVWTKILGLTVVERMDVEAEGVRSAFLSTGAAYGHGTCIELIEPIDHDDQNSTIARRLTDHGEGVFHLAFRTADAAEAARSLTNAGLRAFELPPAGTESTPRAIVHPKSANGILVEILGDR
ncbi:VOC family protein [Rhodococcus erythropolis]|uniref:VOC family protein n=1 Tax=Rhodococcus erythropolis TaxID=1833 RepID=UPI003809253A